MNEFEFQLSQVVKLIESGETGTVIGRAEYLSGENSYHVRYKAADGRQTERWWGASALVAA